MNVEHTKQLLDGVISAGGSDELIDALRSELEAKLTPITAEALLADGWEETWRTEKFGGIIEFSPGQEHFNSTLSFWDVETTLDGTLRSVVDQKNETVKNVVTMYDLRELVRLLGGAQ